MMTGNLPVVPSRASLSASGRAQRLPTIPTAATSAFSARTSIRGVPESFQQHTANLQRSMQDHHVSGLQAVEAGRSAAGWKHVAQRWETSQKPLLVSRPEW